jgi:2-keto-4-pentenoate hydratase/2-oxohepta-3-ene-1,7-dioic acid hydratase in catechol pathway
MKISLPESGLTLQPGKLLCIGRNYAKHAAEMKSDVPETPMVFLKPATALIGNDGVINLPAMTQDVHHEVELVAVVGKEGKNITEDDALDYVAAYAVGLDMTARDIQAVAKQKGHPWSVAKGFDTFAPLGALVPAAAIDDPQDLTIKLTIDGQVRQEGHTGDMIFSVAHLVAYCSRIFTLQPGDLIYTGTPEGVGPVHDGEELTAEISSMPPLIVRVRREG